MVRKGHPFFLSRNLKEESRKGFMEQLLSIEEAARRLGGISKWTLHSWLSQGKIRRTKVGRRTMIRESELEKMVRDEPLPAPGA